MKTNKLNFDKTLSGIFFGQGIAVTDENLVFVSAPVYNNTGIVYVYKQYDTEWNWNELCKINSYNPHAYENFGFSIASNDDGNILAVSSPGKNRLDGIVYIFTGDGKNWNKSYEISGNISGKESFGYNIALNKKGDKIVIGTNIENSSSGKAYLYTGNANNWNLATTFTENDGVILSGNRYRTFYGAKVAINSGDVILIGSFLNNNTGAIFIYTGDNNNWVQSQKLTGSHYNSLFGENFYINQTGNYILAGEPNSFSNSGAVYIYKKNNTSWENEYLITGNTNHLGKCLFINESGNFIFASENNHNGTIHNYRKNGNNWYENINIKNPNFYSSENFGNNFVVDSNYNKLLIGVYDAEYRKGAAYIYERPWNQFQEYYAINEYNISGTNCYCDQYYTCSDCCGIVPYFEIKTGYFNNLNQFSAQIYISIKNNNCNPIYDIFKIYCNGIKIYNDIYNANSLGRAYYKSINLKNIKHMNNLINLELKTYAFGKSYSYYSGIDINNY